MIIEVLDSVNEEIQMYEKRSVSTTCRPLTLKKVTQMLMHRDKPKEGPDGPLRPATYMAKFTVVEAPDMVFSVSWRKASRKTAMKKRVEIIFFKMILSYQKYKVCRDNRINPHRCVCDLSKTSIPGPFQSQ